jgi:Methyltransferase FkbM domain
MNSAKRLFTEYSALARVLEPRDFISLLKATVVNSPSILQTGRLTAIDAAMSHNMTVRLGKSSLVLPLADIDGILAGQRDNPTFGNVREIYARNCYLKNLRLQAPQRAVLDLGANRGMFSLLALVELEAELAVGVEPVSNYLPVYKLLLDANRCDQERAPRYTKFISNPSEEQRDPERNVSVQTILREQKIDRFNLVKMDIEGGEKSVFSEPAWLAYVDTITMELHPQAVGDLSLIPQALERFGFDVLLVDQVGKPASIHSAAFLFASCNGSLAV